MDKETCQKLYQEYQELKKKTEIEVYPRKVGKDPKMHLIDFDNIKNTEKLINIRQQLKTCLEFLTDEELREISEDESELKPEAEKILNKGRGKYLRQ